MWRFLPFSRKTTGVSRQSARINAPERGVEEDAICAASSMKISTIKFSLVSMVAENSIANSGRVKHAKPRVLPTTALPYEFVGR